MTCASCDSAKDRAGEGQPRDSVRNDAPRVSPGSASAAATDSTSGLLRVLVVGTSLTAGLGVDPDSAWPSALQRLSDSAGYHLRIVNAGLSGETSAGALRRVDWLLRERAALVVVETGANDGLRGLDIDSTKANLTALVKKIRKSQPSAPIVVVQMEAPPNLGTAYTTRFHNMFGDVARAEGAELMPNFLDRVAGDPRMNQADGIHPTPAGARILARNAWRTLEPLFRRLDQSASGS
jgi:acyl-CoA thioesterase I